MENWNAEPPSRPDASDVRDALKKGLGRAYFWARDGLLTDNGILLDACLHDMRFDQSVESPRGAWLWELMNVLGVVDEFREPIYEATGRIQDGLAGQQLCEFCVFYARRGDPRFRVRLQEIIKRKPDPATPWLGEKELIDLDRETGFLFAARLRAESLAHREWDWDDAVLINAAIEKLGEQIVTELLNHESQSSPVFARFRDRWHAAAQAIGSATAEEYREQLRSHSVTDIIRDAETMPNQAGVFRGWGRYAADADLQIVLDRLLQSTNTDVIVNYLRVFSNRTMPNFDRRFLGLLDHADSNVRARAYAALGKSSHPEIRNFAVGQIANRITEPSFLELFVRNFQLGDESLLLANLVFPTDADERHGLLMDVKEILSENPKANCEKLGLLVYRFTPCAECRYDMVKLLFNRNVVPDWMVKECQFDVVEETRQLAESCDSQANAECSNDDSRP